MMGREDSPERVPFFEALGMITSLMMNSRYESWLVSDIACNIMPALRVGQCKIYFDGTGAPSAFVTWACVDDASHDALRLEGRNPPPEKWTSGRNLWVIDLVAPFGNTFYVIKQDLYRSHFKGYDVAHAIRRNPDGSVRRIQVWRRRGGRAAQV